MVFLNYRAALLSIAASTAVIGNAAAQGDPERNAYFG
jgi:hypothetical protein